MSIIVKTGEIPPALPWYYQEHEFEMSQADIDMALPAEPSRCPVANTIVRTKCLDPGDVNVYGAGSIYVKNNLWGFADADTSVRVRKFIKNFDHARAVKPINFILVEVKSGERCDGYDPEMAYG